MPTTHTDVYTQTHIATMQWIAVCRLVSGLRYTRIVYTKCDYFFLMPEFSSFLLLLFVGLQTWEGVFIVGLNVFRSSVSTYACRPVFDLLTRFHYVDKGKKHVSIFV